MRRFVISLVAGLVCVGLAGCGSGGSDSGSGGTSPSASPSLTGDITVFAAASLTESFTKLGQQFEAANPGVSVTFSFAGSSALATQITSGAPADVFASASAKNMETVVAAGAASDPQMFAANVMEIAVPPANPGEVTGVDSLASADVNASTSYPIATLTKSANAAAAAAFVDYVLSPDGAAVLAAAGFQQP